MHDRGQAMVELALLLPVLVFGIAGGADFARVYAAYFGATNAARAGAELAVVKGWTTSANDAAIEQQAVDELKEIPTLGNADATWTSVSHTTVSGVNFVSVTVHFDFNTIIAWPFLPQTVTVDRTQTFRNYP